MSSLPILVALLLSRHPAIPVTVDVLPGEVLSGTRDIRVNVGELKSGLVQQVEFYLNGDLRDSVSGYPYIFKLNTIDLDDGDAKLEFQVQTTLGEKGQTSVNVKIDNGVSKGVDYHVQRGLAFLSDSKFQDAEVAGRLAMKAAQRLQDAGSNFDEKRDMNPARVVLARAYLGLGKYDRAEKFAEDALSADPTNRKLEELASGVGIRRALETVDHSGDADSSITAMGDALKTAISRRQKVLLEDLDKLGDPTSSNALQYADLAMKAGRYSLALQALQLTVQENPLEPTVVNRFAFAQIRNDRLSDAMATLTVLKKRGHFNAYSYALMAVLCSATGDKAGQEDNIKEAILNGSDNLGVQTAEAYLALRDGKIATLADILKNMQANYPDSPESSVLNSVLATRQGQPDAAHSYFEDAVIRDPLLVDSYLEEARYSLALANQGGKTGKQKFFFKIAKMYYDIAASARPESVEALVGMSLTNSALGDADAALNFAKAATTAGKGYAAGHYALALLYHDKRDSEKFLAEMKLASQLDQRNLAGMVMPTSERVMHYFVRFGASPLIAAP